MFIPAFRLIKRTIPTLLFVGAGIGLTSCFDDKEPLSEQYKEWRERNEQYILDQESKTNADGTPYYTKIIPSWAPEAYALVHWYNDRSLTSSNLSPMDNSTVKITYELFDIDGERISDSFSAPDSIYTSKPLNNIVGVWAPLTHMHVGDSVAIVIPSQAGYGERNYGGIKPYSTLVYNVKLKAVSAYEVP